MNEENYKNVNSLPERMEEIIYQVQNDSSITGALQNDKKFYSEFTLLLSDLNAIISEEKESSQKYSQISMF
ncbi:MAG TPA: hypothetical protein VLN45_03680 [Ignavibacteriaceae bacterium]|nr:hypothetical protein [Ignavibacteriaceae bacterium]